MNRHLSRLVAMQTLYEWDFRHADNMKDIVKRNIDEYKNDVDEPFITAAIKNVVDNLALIDAEIETSAPEWPLDQIAIIDKTILRLAVCELLYFKATPPKVVINEAVELAKQFGSSNSSRFVNGVLGAVFEHKISADK